MVPLCTSRLSTTYTKKFNIKVIWVRVLGLKSLKYSEKSRWYQDENYP